MIQHLIFCKSEISSPTYITIHSTWKEPRTLPLSGLWSSRGTVPCQSFHLPSPWDDISHGHAKQTSEIRRKMEMLHLFLTLILICRNYVKIKHPHTYYANLLGATFFSPQIVTTMYNAHYAHRIQFCWLHKAIGWSKFLTWSHKTSRSMKFNKKLTTLANISTSVSCR